MELPFSVQTALGGPEIGTYWTVTGMMVIAGADVFRRGGSVQQIDSQYQIDPNAWATYEAARAQADAAIRAAEIGRDAAWDAAALQVWVGAPIAVLAAISALIAAGLAYKAAIKAAETQVKLEREKHDNRVTAYGIRQSKLIERLSQSINEDRSMLEGLIDEKTEQYREEFGIPIHIYEEPRDWSDDEWENHHLLGINFMHSLVKAKEHLKQLTYAKEAIISISLPNNGSDGMYNFKEDWEDRTFVSDDGFEQTDFHPVYNIDWKLRTYEKALYNFDDALSKLRKSIPETCFPVFFLMDLR